MHDPPFILVGASARAFEQRLAEKGLKLGAPQQPEFAIGAVAEAGARVIDVDLGY